MSLPKRRKIRTFALLFCVITFTTFLFSYTFRDPSLYFFKYAFRISDNFFSKGLCACRQCMTELEDDPWFAERFNQSVHPLMTRENSVLSDETFKWWQWLQSERQPANFSEVVEELFQVIPDEVLYMDASPERCRTCAVVGNSGNLKGAQYGGLIDSNDFIIRSWWRSKMELKHAEDYVKFAVDTTIISGTTINDETSYREEINSVAEWCTECKLLLNVSKTKELIVYISGAEVKQVTSFKFLRFSISENLTWSSHISTLVKKA